MKYASLGSKNGQKLKGRKYDSNKQCQSYSTKRWAIIKEVLN